MPTKALTVDPGRLLPGSWPLLLIMAAMLALSLLSIQIVAWTGAYAHGHSLWAMAEHQAVSELRSYAYGRDPANWERFEAEVRVPLGDREARRQLESDSPDYDRVRQGFLEGRVPEEDIPGLIRLFRLFGFHPLVARAIRAWAEADARIVELVDVGAQLHAEIGDGMPDGARVRALISQVDRIHGEIAPLLREFGNVLREAQKRIVLLLLVVLPLCAVALVGVGVAIGRALNRRAKAAARALSLLTRRLEHRATHDALTGLANRTAFEARLAQCLAAASKAGDDWTLLYLDLDQFKIVNDTCGHAAGDALIRRVGGLLREAVVPGSIVARLGGDEFGLLMPGSPPREAAQIAERIRDQLESFRFAWESRTFAISVSIGVLPLDGGVATVAEAFSAADQACFLAKDHGRNRVWLYRPDDREVQQRRGEMGWVERLQKALDSDAFVLVAQEIRPVAQPQCPGSRHVELLLRIVDEDGELVPPMAFIPSAERYGLMPRIDRWVIARACRELAALRARGAPLPVCMINLSGTSASDPGLADYVADCLREHRLAPSLIGLELTETAAVANLEACCELMARLRALGCPTALDDFGAGMSSFSYLRRLPVDLLKIDRGFIRNIGSDAIDYALVETIQRIAGIMGMRTVAEGVENAAVMDRLALIGVDFAQGFHLHRPVPLSQIDLAPTPEVTGAQRLAGP